MVKLTNAAMPARTELWEGVLVALRSAILCGELAPGTRLVETELAQELKVSRWPVRQAITRLTQEGLVERTPNHGAYVAEFSAEDIHEIGTLRCFLEEHAARLLCERMTSEDETRLRSITEEMRHQAELGHTSEVNRCDVEFHHAVMNMAGSARLLKMWEILIAPLHALLNLRARNMGTAITDVMAERHEALVDALASGDPTRAAEAVVRHAEVIEVGLTNPPTQP